jgi:hypothetical protein
MFQQADPILGSVFDKDVLYRSRGQTISLRASLRAHDIVANEENGLYESWHGHVWELRADALTIDGQTFDPVAGDEVAEPQADGTLKIYEVVPLPKKRCFDPVDAEEFKLLVYTKVIRTEPTP